MRFKILLVARVPVFADLVIEAETQEAAEARAVELMEKVEAGAPYGEETIDAIRWSYGLSPELSLIHI